MFSKDVQIVLGPNVANELNQLLQWWRRFPGKAGPPLLGQAGTRTYGSIPAPKIGKAYENIAPRTFGNVKMWAGVPGQETETTFLTDPVQEFNLLDRTITSGYWCWMFGQYIFGAHFPAADVWGTVGANVTAGGNATVTVTRHANGDDPGATIIGYADETYTGTTIASSKYVRCRWDDRGQKYWIVGAAC